MQSAGADNTGLAKGRSWFIANIERAEQSAVLQTASPRSARRIRRSRFDGGRHDFIVRV
jgi:hypothetical protein